MQARKKHHWKYFFLKIVIPSIIAIGLFIISIFTLIIPSFEKSILNSKKSMLKELTQTAIAVIKKSEEEAKEFKLPLDKAKQLALSRVKFLHYGQENKDYFWITDTTPTMIMHPYRKDLIGKNLSNFQDKKGKKLFLEFVKMVKAKNDGFVNYYWQWQDNPSRTEPKISYVKLFEPWDWVIGTGIYIHDVNQEISSMEKSVILISFIIILVISFILFFIIIQSSKIEKKKLFAEEKLNQSMEKYQILLESSTEGFLLLLDRKISYSNSAMLKMLGYNLNDLIKQELCEIVITNEKDNIVEILEKNQILDFEAKMKNKNGVLIDVIITSSNIKFHEQNGIILIAKNISNSKQLEIKRIEKEKENYMVELQSSLLFLNQPIKNLIKKTVSCSMNETIQNTASKMSKYHSQSILIKNKEEYMGIVTDKDFRKRVIEKKIDFNKPIYQIMSSPLITISNKALVFETILKMQEKKVKYLPVMNRKEEIIGLISYHDLIHLQSYSHSTMLKEISSAKNELDLFETHKKLPLMIKTLVDSGANAKNITRFYTKVSDEITTKLIEYYIHKTGSPPTSFAFMALGSEAREEITFTSDQDNALVFEDIPKNKEIEIKTYFLEMGEFVCNQLNKIGYSFCEGEIMAKNPKWCQPLKKWKKYFYQWITTPTPQNLLEINTFCDFRSIYTYSHRKKQPKNFFYEELKTYINQLIQNKNDFIIFLAKNAINYKSPIGFLGNIITETYEDSKEAINIKDSLILLVNFARVYSLQHQISENNTLDRLEKLFEEKIIDEIIFKEITHIYNYLVQLRFKHQASLIDENKEPHNYIDLNKLTSIEKGVLKKVLSNIKIYQNKLGYDFLGRSLY